MPVDLGALAFGRNAGAYGVLGSTRAADLRVVPGYGVVGYVAVFRRRGGIAVSGGYGCYSQIGVYLIVPGDERAAGIRVISC